MSEQKEVEGYLKSHNVNIDVSEQNIEIALIIKQTIENVILEVEHPTEANFKIDEARIRNTYIEMNLARKDRDALIKENKYLISRIFNLKGKIFDLKKGEN